MTAGIAVGVAASHARTDAVQAASWTGLTLQCSPPLQHTTALGSVTFKWFSAVKAAVRSGRMVGERCGPSRQGPLHSLVHSLSTHVRVLCLRGTK